MTDDEMTRAGFEGIGSAGWPTGRDGLRWPNVVWPAQPDLDAFRGFGWDAIQDAARTHATRTGQRVLVYAYFGPYGWAYTIGNDMCRMFAYRPGVRDGE